MGLLDLDETETETDSGKSSSDVNNTAFNPEFAKADAVLVGAATRENDEFKAEYEGERKVVNQNFTYPTHTDQERMKDATGIYLDDVKRREAEVQRAKIEGREPDLDDPPAIQSTPLVPTYVAKGMAPTGSVVVPDKQLPVVQGTPADVDEDE